MSDTSIAAAQQQTKIMMEALIRFSIVAIIVFLCWQVFAPFLGIMLWGIIMAIALYPVHQWLAKRLDNKQGRSSTIMVFVAMLLFGIPIALLGTSAAEHAQKIHTVLETGELEIDPPKDTVAEWPVVGEKVYTAWNDAATDFPTFLKENSVLIKKYSRKILDTILGSVGTSLFLFGAFVVAAIFMAFAQPGIKAMKHIFIRISGPKTGPELQDLCTATVRSVTVGVLGVAFIQAILFGIGFVLAGIPAAGLLALVVLVVAIVQVPALLVGLPVIIFMWTKGDASTAMNIFFSIYFVAAALSDNLLKPILLGRGVAAPMPVILLGALGGMVSAGFIGLFIGAVVLAVGYVIFTGWVNNTLEEPLAENEAPVDAE